MKISRPNFYFCFQSFNDIETVELKNIYNSTFVVCPGF